MSDNNLPQNPSLIKNQKLRKAYSQQRWKFSIVADFKKHHIITNMKHEHQNDTKPANLV